MHKVVAKAPIYADLPPKITPGFKSPQEQLEFLRTIGLVSVDKTRADTPYSVNLAWNPADHDKTAIYSQPMAAEEAITLIRKNHGPSAVDSMLDTHERLNHLIHWGAVAEFHRQSGILWRYAALSEWKPGISASEENPAFDRATSGEVNRPKQVFKSAEEAVDFAEAQIRHAELEQRLPKGTLRNVLSTYPPENTAGETEAGVMKPTAAQMESWRVRLQNLLPGLRRHNGKEP